MSLKEVPGFLKILQDGPAKLDIKKVKAITMLRDQKRPEEERSKN